MGKSNADVRTISTSPIRARAALHEHRSLNTSATIARQVENPIETSILKYQAWSKKTKISKTETPKSDQRLKHDPPDYANVRSKVENLRLSQRNLLEKSLTDSFSQFLKTSGVSLRSQFLKLDKSRKGFVSLQDFREVLDKVAAPAFLIQNSSKLFEELGGKNEILDYFEASKMVSAPTLPQLTIVDRSEQLRIIDKRTVPPNQLENLFNYGKRIRQFLKTTYQNPEKLSEDLEKLGKNDRISLKSLKNFVVEKLLEDPSLRITQRELEGFLGSYDYNKDQDTSSKEVAKYVFLDDLVAANYLHVKKRAIPPLRDSSRHEPGDLPRLKKLLLDIEQKVFTQGPNQTLPAFRMFDKDNDGFLTQEDLEQGLGLMQVPHSSEDTQKLFSFLDENGNGFVTFAEFSKVIQPNIITVNASKLQETEERHLNVSQPSTSFYINQKNRLPEAFLPGLGESALKVPNRYSSSPPFQDTFSNFAPIAESAMFLPDKDRYSAKKFDPTNLNHEDKEKTAKVSEARVEVRRQMREKVEKRVREIENKELELENNKIANRARMKNEYEVKCKMGIIN
jgi:Ca2+-binding EF-hand superfamily protein